MDHNGIKSLEKLIRTLTARTEELRAQLKEAETDLNAAMRSLRLLQDSMPEVEQKVPAKIEGVAGGGTQREALVGYARTRGGRFRAKDAADYLLKAGVVSSPHHYQIIFNILVQSGLFERVARGEYRLKNPTA